MSERPPDDDAKGESASTRNASGPTRANTAARKLMGGALSPRATGPIPSEGGASKPVPSEGGASKPLPSEGGASKPLPAPSVAPPSSTASRDAAADIYAARRGMVTGKLERNSIHPSKAPPPPKADGGFIHRHRKVFLGVMLAGALGFGAYQGFLAMKASSPEGRVRGALIAWELSPRDPAVRDKHFAAIDAMGARGLTTAVSLLADSAMADDGKSHSNAPVQKLANLYLLHYAEVVKLEPPAAAAEVRNMYLSGKIPPAGKWKELQTQWAAWLADAQAKGVAPKG